VTTSFNASLNSGEQAGALARNAISRRGLLGGALSASALFGLAACGGGGSSTLPGQQASVAGGGGAEEYTGPAVSLAFWNGLTGGDGPIMRKIISRFNSEHPNIKVTMTAIAWPEYFQKLPATVTNGTAPDIGLMHNNDLATNAARQVISPLDDVANALKLTNNDFATIAWDGGLYQGKRYGIPLDVHPAGLFYNKNVMEKAGLDPEKPPTTGDEMLQMLDTLKSKGIQGWWVSPGQVQDPVQSATLIYQYGGKMVNDDGQTVGWGDEPAIKAITYFKNVIDQGYSPKNASVGSDFVSFSNDKSAFFLGGPWNTTPLTAIKKLKYGAAPVPNIGGTQATWAGSHQFVLPRQIKPDQNKAQASRVFINWISQQSLNWADAGMVPARNEVRNAPEFKQKGLVNEFAKEIDYIHFVPPVPGVTDIDPIWVTATSNAMLGKQPIDAALKDATVRANKVLAANKKKYG
jgi:multiple sugar transport system substrate-binding protein